MPARPRGASGAIAPPSDISLKLNPKKIKKLIKTAENLAAVQTIQQTLKRLPLLPTAFASFTLKQNKPKDGAPTEGGPTEGAPKGGAPIDGAPKGGAPTGGAPIEGAPKGGAPIEGAPKGGAPIEGASIEGAPKGGAPIEGAPKGGGPVEGAPIRGIGGPPVGIVEAAKDPLVAFLHFRLEVEEGQPVVYLYELQIKEAYRSRSIGRRLLFMLEVFTRKLNKDMKHLRLHAAANKLVELPPAAAAATAAGTAAAAATAAGTAAAAAAAAGGTAATAAAAPGNAAAAAAAAATSAAPSTAAAATTTAAAAEDPLLLPIQLKKIMCTVLRCNERAMSFYKNVCRYTSDESCPLWLLQQQRQQQQQQLTAADATEDEEEPEYEILKKVITP
ncbi:acetyltransferase domain-containing protein, putative [Eimeria acervulina]|uniref:Acetyltransferase domain-containing protein, putative n=1 Tax=Eimeria acervulina TaxID=5801 RepID=U6GT32_EIMAC|nr:acetyltransferase domain-containing protein, putative [Eimeria acervulina]CDI83335.1 acetyltransferase domain-containing protein, putative [Eimeria acervulina]